MILSDFLSKQKHDDSDPHKIIPISFNMYGILQEKYYNIGNSVKYLGQTQSLAKSSGIKLPEVHGISKGLDPNIQLEKQISKPLFMETPQMKTKNRRGKSRIKVEESPINQSIAQSAENSKIAVLPKYLQKA